MTDDQRFRKNLTGLGELFGREITKTLASLYWRLFTDWTDDQFETACQMAANQLKFFPKPAELRELVQGQNPELESTGSNLLDAYYARQREVTNA